MVNAIDFNTNKCVKVNDACQRDRIWHRLGDKPLDMSVWVFQDGIEVTRPVVSDCSSE